MTTLTLCREDFANPLHPNMWRDICEQLDLAPAPASGDTTDDDWPDQITLTVSKARIDE